MALFRFSWHQLFSLRYRIAATVFVLEAIMLFWVLSTTLNYLEQRAQEETAQRHQVIADLLLELTRNAMLAEEYDDLQLYVERLSESADVVSISVINRRNILVVHSDFHRVGSAPQWQPVDKTQRLLELPINNRGQIQVVFSEHSVYQQIAEGRSLALWLAVVGMGAIALAGILIGSVLTRRLTNLMDAVQGFKHTGHWQQVSHKGHDEVSQLSAAFNLLGQEIDHNVRQLHQQQMFLEERVEQRTEELQQAHNQLLKSNQALEKLAHTDHLTGLNNRIRIESSLEQLLRLNAQQDEPFVLILLDVDHFKQVNDTYGHDVGDSTLLGLADLLLDEFTEPCQVGRWGGEEFIVLCPGLNLGQGVEAAEGLRQRIECHTFMGVGQVTCSMGVTSTGIDPVPSAKVLLRAADEALYRAKARGRNRVVADKTASSEAESLYF